MAAWDYLGIYWGYIGIMEKKMETTGIIGFSLNLRNCTISIPTIIPLALKLNAIIRLMYFL